MKNIDKIRAMSAEELADMLVDKNTVQCDNCMIYGFCHDNYCNAEYSCKDVVTKWLNQEVNPMPKLEVGDLIDANSWRYVAIGNDIVVNPSGMGKFCLSSMKDIKTIWRYKVNRYEAIWRADNEN